MNDRGMIKWQPFNSVISGKTIIESIQKEKSKLKKPIMSEEEINYLEKNIIDAYFMKENVNITYFQDGEILQVNGKIKKIDQIYKLVYLDYKKLLFSQIINIILL